MTDQIATADTFAAEATAELAELVADTADAAAELRGFTAGHTLDIDRLVLRGTPDQLEAWRDTRVPDVRLRELVARWRDHWTTIAHGIGRKAGTVPANLKPRGLDLYGWHQPEACDHEAVRHGATAEYHQGRQHLTVVHVDLVRLAQQDTPFRLLGPTEALDLIGPDGIVQPGHPLRSGTYSSRDAVPYEPGRPTWIPGRDEHTPGHHTVTRQDQARALNAARNEGRIDSTGTIWGASSLHQPNEPASAVGVTHERLR